MLTMHLLWTNSSFPAQKAVKLIKDETCILFNCFAYPLDLIYYLNQFVPSCLDMSCKVKREIETVCIT